MSESPVEFGDGAEPWSVARGNRKLWLHCRAEAAGLPAAWRTELATWLAERDGPQLGASLLVTRDDSGYQLHTSGATVAVSLDELPQWLRKPTAEPPAAKAPARTRRT